MRKAVNLVLLLSFLFFLTTISVNASRSMCTYVVGDSTITVNYDYTKSPTYSISGGVNSSKTKVEEVKDLKNDQFYKNGKLVCPNLNKVSRRSHAKNNYTYTLSPTGEAKYGSAEGNISILENDGAENGGVIKDDDIGCVYKKGTTKTYTLKWKNGKVIVELNGPAYTKYCKDDTTIKQDEFSEKDFKNGKCPDVYETEVNKHQNLSGSCKGKLIISKNPILTNEDPITENDNDKDTNNQSTTSNSKTDTPFAFCDEVGVLKTFKLVGYLLTIIKILVPLLLIIFGSIDMAKAVLAGDDKAIKSSTQMLATRVAAGIIIFFIPSIINFAMSLVSNWGTVKSEFSNCQKCLFETGKCTDKFLKKTCEGQSNKDITCSLNSYKNNCVCEEK